MYHLWHLAPLGWALQDLGQITLPISSYFPESTRRNPTISRLPATLVITLTTSSQTTCPGDWLGIFFTSASTLPQLAFLFLPHTWTPQITSQVSPPSLNASLSYYEVLSSSKLLRPSISLPLTLLEFSSKFGWLCSPKALIKNKLHFSFMHAGLIPFSLMWGVGLGQINCCFSIIPLGKADTSSILVTHWNDLLVPTGRAFYLLPMPRNSRICGNLNDHIRKRLSYGQFFMALWQLILGRSKSLQILILHAYASILHFLNPSYIVFSRVLLLHMRETTQCPSFIIS